MFVCFVPQSSNRQQTVLSPMAAAPDTARFRFYARNKFGILVFDVPRNAQVSVRGA
jgi:hypothetical protein